MSNYFDWNSDSSGNYSSFDSLTPYGLSQTFSFPFAVGTLGVSRTRNSIASREILLSLDKRGVHGINKRVLDPRRPKGTSLTSQDKEEGLVLYKAQLDYVPTDTLSYNLQVS